MFQMKVVCVLLCFSIAWAEEGGSFTEQGGGVRGPRIVEHKTQSDCKEEKNWPVCADDDWGSKCPSGCRMQGLIDETDQDFNERINAIRRLLADNQNNYKKSNALGQQTINFLKSNLINEQQGDNNYGQLSEDLNRRLVNLKERVVNQVNRIKVLQNSIRNQVVEMKRLEVDIDIKIRACKGSCARTYNYQVDTESYENIQKHLVQAGTINQNVRPELEKTPLRILKMRVLKESSVPEHFKAAHLPEHQEMNILQELKPMEFSLEGQGAEFGSSSVAVKHVVSGAVAEGPSHTTTKIVTPGYERDTSARTEVSYKCVKTVSKKVVQGPDGPREEITEEVRSLDGSDCSHVQGSGRDSASTYHIKVNPGPAESGSPDASSLFLDAKEFFSSDPGSRVHSTGSSRHTVTFGGSDVHADLAEGEVDEFPSFDFPSHRFHSKTSGTSSSSRTVVSSSSSSTSSFNKGGSTFETKSIKVPESLDELLALQHDESGEDAPDFRARSLSAGGEKQGESYIGTDCEDIHQKHTSGAQSGIFRIKPAGSIKVFSVYCDQETTLGGWLLIQQRLDGSLNFNRTWEDYKKGFGSVDGKGKGEFWLGNENLHILTQKDTVLRVEVEDWEGNEAYAEYNMHIGSESEGYSLSVSDYEGTAGDALITGSEEEGSEYTTHANMTFSTFDQDSDQWEENCAEVYGGGWWYNNCQAANLNGIYYSGGQYDPRNNIPFEIENGIVWVSFKPSDYSLKVVRMKIRPIKIDEM